MVTAESIFEFTKKNGKTLGRYNFKPDFYCALSAITDMAGKENIYQIKVGGAPELNMTVKDCDALERGFEDFAAAPSTVSNPYYAEGQRLAKLVGY